MIQLYLNNVQVVVSDRLSIKLILENQYFSEADSYTYEVTIPLTCELNRKLFGHINRQDVKKQSIIMTARLYCNGVTILDGRATVLSVSDTELKVQLLGAASFYVSDNNNKETYIDKLDLGKWDWFGFTNNPDETTTGGLTGQRPGADGKIHGSSGTNDSYENIIDRILGGIGHDYVMYPVENSNTGDILNFYCFRSVTSGGNDYRLDYSTFRKRARVEDETDHEFRDSYQPFLWYAVKMIAEATGKTLADEDNIFKTNNFFNRIFIVTAYSSRNKTEALPHWTVNEWWSYIEKAFGVVVVMSETEDKIRIISRKEYYASSRPMYYVDKVEDSFTADLDDETSADLSVSNVSFADHDNNPYELVDEDIISQVVIDTRFANLQELVDWAKPIKSTVYDSYCNYLFKTADGHNYILAQYLVEDKLLIYEVDQFGPRIVNPDKDTNELEIKFVPCKTVDIDCPVYKYNKRVDGGGATLIQEGTFTVRALSRPERECSEPFTDAVEDLIEGESSSDEDSKPDVCYIGLLGGYDSYSAEITGKSYNFQYPRGHARELNYYNITDNKSAKEDSGYSLSLKKVDGVITLYDETVKDSVVVDVRVKQCFKFLSTSIPDPASVFVIQNKTYLCRQLEVEITSKGMNKLITGYFYLVDL